MKLIKLECPNCHAALEVDSEREVAYCQYCGTKILLDDETININAKIEHSIRDEAEILKHKTKRDVELAKLKYEAEDDKRTWRIIIGGLVICMGILFAMWGYEVLTDNLHKHKVATMAEEGKFTVGDHTDLEGKKYKGVVKLLKSAGFTDIEKVDLGDKLIISPSNSKVVSVSIDGNTEFSRNDFWDGSEHVVVTYH